MSPRISVVMAVYNVEGYVQRAVDSILSQTFGDFECLVINDASTDGTRDILGAYRDRRLKLEDNERNLGLTLSLNRGLALARGEFIARMDGDDESLPGRFAAQVEFLSDHVEVGVCGTAVEIMGQGAGAVWRPPCGHDEIQCGLFFESMLFHPTVMLRKQVLEEHGISYDPTFQRSQDYDLWVRLVRLTRLANLPEVWLRYNRHEAQVGQLHKRAQLDFAGRVRHRQLLELCPSATTTDQEIHHLIGGRNQEGLRGRRREGQLWLRTLSTLNEARRLFPEPAFSECVQQKSRWLEAHTPTLFTRAVRKVMRLVGSLHRALGWYERQRR